MNDKVNRAQLQIAEILRALEREEYATVESIRVEDFDVTTLDSRYPQHKRQVIIEMKRQPGQDWLT